MRFLHRSTAAPAAVLLLLAALSGCSFARDDSGLAPPEPVPTETARAAAERYVGFLEDGDAESASAMNRPFVEHPEKVFAGTELLTNDAFSKAVARIEDAKVGEEIDSSGDFSSTFAISFTLDGVEHDEKLTLHSEIGKWWVFSGGTGSIFVQLVPPEGDKVPATYEIAGQTVTMAENGRPGFILMPGVYTLTIDVPESLVVDPAANPLTREIVINFDGTPTDVRIPVTALP